MEKYDYLSAVEEDVKNYIECEVDFNDFEDLDELQDYLNDALWADDSVTGNGSGSYTFSTWQAEENLCHNLDLLDEAMNECGGGDILKDGAEACDVTIRCYLLAQAIGNVAPDMWQDWEDSKED